MAAARGHTSTAAAAGPPAWSPLDLASLTAWWDFSDAATLFTDAGTTRVSADAQAIYQANDKSASGFHVVQATEGARPTYKTGIQNSRSVARFDGGDSLAKASVDALTVVTADAGTIVIVIKQSSADSQNTSIAIGGSNTNRLLIHATYSSKFYFDFGNVAAGGRYYVDAPVGWADAWHVLVCRRAGGPVRIYVDGGTAVGSGTMTDSLDAVTDTLSIGTGGGATFTGDKAEVLVFNEGLSTANLNALGAYLAAKWGLSWTDIT